MVFEFPPDSGPHAGRGVCGEMVSQPDWKEPKCCQPGFRCFLFCFPEGIVPCVPVVLVCGFGVRR